MHSLYDAIVHDLIEAGKISPYPADANEPDPRYKSYGVRANEKKAIFSRHRRSIRALSPADQVKLGKRLIRSEIGDQQGLGLYVLEPNASYFAPQRFDELDELARLFYGWSKVDGFTGFLLRDILFAHSAECQALVRRWNADPDMWLQRTSVVLFTRKVAKSGQFTNFALEMCDNLKFSPEDLVRKGVGWSLKDLMKADKPRILKYVRQLRQEGVSSTITLYALRDVKGDERRQFMAK